MDSAETILWKEIPTVPGPLQSAWKIPPIFTSLSAGDELGMIPAL